MDDNPALSEERKQAIFKQLQNNPFLLERDWYGRRCVPHGVIYSMFSHKDNIVNKIEGDIVEMYFSGDGGLSDATSICCNLVVRTRKDGKLAYKLYRAANYYYSGRDTGKVKAMSIQAREIAHTFMPWCRNAFKQRETITFIDPACKALREELELLGIVTKAADNNAKDIKGNVKGIKVGVERCQSSIEERRLLWLDTERYGHYDCLRELSMYVLDNQGNPVDIYNHALDEMRYGHNYFYKQYLR
jgi:PBSX family phage terminase large subunit